MTYGPEGFFIMEMFVMPKVYKSHRSQLQILRGRGLSIVNGSKAMRILEKENYYNVINGYKSPFVQHGVTPEAYTAGTKFDELYSVFCFDRNVRLIYLKYILKAEHHIKSVIAHEFSKRYGHDNYLKLDNFDSSSTQKTKEVLKTIGKIQNCLSDKMGKSQEITHYVSTYGYVPLWVLMNVLTLGEMSHFYANMKQSDQNQVARQFNLQPAELRKYIKNMTLARNRCAHDERFYDYMYKESLSVTTIPSFGIFAIPASSGNYAYGTKDAFSLAVILTLILSKADAKEFVSAIDREFKRLDKELTTVSASHIMLKMGFGPNWKKLPQLR